MGYLDLVRLSKPKAVRVEIGDAEDFVYFRSLTASELVDMQRSSGSAPLGADAAFDFNLQFLARVLVDAEGNQLVSDPSELRTLPVNLVLHQLLPAALQVSGLGEKKVP